MIILFLLNIYLAKLIIINNNEITDCVYSLSGFVKFNAYRQIQIINKLNIIII